MEACHLVTSDCVISRLPKGIRSSTEEMVVTVAFPKDDLLFYEVSCRDEAVLALRLRIVDQSVTINDLHWLNGSVLTSIPFHTFFRIKNRSV
jgi:hypothetical protein